MKNIKRYTEMIRESMDQEDLNSSLIRAIESRRLEECERLLDAGADVDARIGPLKRTPLHYACMYGSAEIVRILLDRGADLDARDSSQETPLHLACKNDRKLIIEILIDKGADVNAKTNYGQVPLQWAVWQKGGTGQMLMDAGADPFLVFPSAQEILDFTGGDIDWMPDALKAKIKRMKKGKSAFGM